MSESIDTHARMVFAAIAVLALAIVGAGYWWSGARVPASPATVVPVSAPHGTRSDQVTAMTERLATRLEQQPEDVEGWAMLARSYSVLGRHPGIIHFTVGQRRGLGIAGGVPLYVVRLDAVR